MSIVLTSVAFTPLEAAFRPKKPAPLHFAQHYRQYKAAVRNSKATQHANPVHTTSTPVHTSRTNPVFRPKMGHLVPTTVKLNTGTPHIATPNIATPNTGTPHTGTPRFATFSPQLTHGPHAPAKVALSLSVKPNHPAVHLRNVYFPIHRAPYKLLFGGVPRTFVALAALGIVRIDGGYWRPDGYVRISRRFCSGVSEDGCQLHWRMVDFEGGGNAAQCVQYCPYSGAPPTTVAALPLPPPPPPANAACQIALFAQPSFGGEGAPTNETQPDLAAVGWQNAVASIQVQAGVWDVFTEANFSGESMRLETGNYPTLPQGWDKNIGSMQCVQLGAPSAQ